MIGLRNPHIFSSISAFAPVSSPNNSPWGRNALLHYLGSDESLWQEYDACSLFKKYPWPHGEILVDQGEADPFLNQQLKPERLVESAAAARCPLTLRMQPHYDHSYYFISSFIAEHVHFHGKNW